MNAYKISTAILAVLLMASSATAAVLYTMREPATVTIDTPAWTLYDPTCTTPVPSINFGTIKAGGNASLIFCLKNSGQFDQWITTNSVSSNLSSNIGTVKATAFGSFSLPLEFKPGDHSSITLLFVASPTAPTGAAKFAVQIIAYSTSGG